MTNHNSPRADTLHPEPRKATPWGARITATLAGAVLILVCIVFAQAYHAQLALDNAEAAEAELQQREDSLRTQLEELSCELRSLKKYITPDSAWIHEQISAHIGDPEIQSELTRYFIVYALQVGISPRVLAAVGRVESAYRQRAISRADAHGLMQVLPDVWWNRFRDECGEWNPYDERRSICYGAHILRYELDRWGDLSDALSAYNSGLPADSAKYAPNWSRAGARYARRVAAVLD